MARPSQIDFDTDKPPGWNRGVTMHRFNAGGGGLDLINGLPSVGTGQSRSVCGGALFPAKP